MDDPKQYDQFAEEIADVLAKSLMKYIDHAVRARAKAVIKLVLQEMAKDEPATDETEVKDEA